MLLMHLFSGAPRELNSLNELILVAARKKYAFLGTWLGDKSLAELEFKANKGVEVGSQEIVAFHVQNGSTLFFTILVGVKNSGGISCFNFWFPSVKTVLGLIWRKQEN